MWQSYRQVGRLSRRSRLCVLRVGTLLVYDARVSVNSIEVGLARYVEATLAEATGVVVDELERIHGGASRETFRLRLRYRQDERDFERRLILRRDPGGSLIDTERRTEFAAYRAVHGSPVPVPEVLWLEEGDDWLGAPFFVMEEVRGFESEFSQLTVSPYAECAAQIGRSKWTVLGELAKLDPAKLDLDGAFEAPAPGDCWRVELEKWERELDADERTPQPVTRAAIRWLRRNPPPPPERVSFVHGDFRSGNFLFDESGVQAVLDWEMAHLGDPLEDLGWSLQPTWRVAKDDRVGGLLLRDEAISVWEAASGRRVDPDALHWWELMACVKGQAIWVSAGKEYVEGSNKDAVLALSAWAVALTQDRGTIEVMERHR